MAGECEICGESGAYYYILLEGARLHACERCASHGKILSSETPVQGSKPKTEPKTVRIELMADFGRKIKEAREKMKIERKVLAEMVNEKESFIERIENDKTIPSEALSYRLEKALGIKLFEQVKYEQVGEKKKGKGLTLGDVVVIKKK